MKQNINIVEMQEKHHEQVKNLLVDLQKYVIEIDKYGLNILSEEYREKYFDYLLNDCKNMNGKIYVYENDGCAVGMIAGYVETYSPRDQLVYSCPKKGIVAELIVDKNFRKDGIGAMLLEKIEKYFKLIGCEYVQIDVFAYNQNAKNFYYKHGYEDRMIMVFKKLDA